MTALDRRLAAMRPDLADERLRDRVEAAAYVRGEPFRLAAASAPLRREPRLDAPIDTEALRGEAVTVFDRRDGHAWVQIEDGYVGYLSEDTLGSAEPAPTHRVAALRTFVYAGPNLKLRPLGALSLGARLAPTEVEKGYGRVAGDGWVWLGHLAPDGEFEGDFVAVAERLVGVPYLWGGKTSLGLDCSGLVQLAMAQAGLPAPRDTDMQERALGAPADRAALRRGDLVFWRGHVGIMLDAETLLHANGHHMAVAVEPLDVAEARILMSSYGPITGFRRLERLGADA